MMQGVDQLENDVGHNYSGGEGNGNIGRDEGHASFIVFRLS